MDDVTKAYLAGIFDGEGWVTLKTNSKDKVGNNILILECGVSMTDFCVPKLFKECFNGHLNFRPTRRGTNFPSCSWIARSQLASNFIIKILPFSKVKYPQLQLGLEFRNYIENVKDSYSLEEHIQMQNYYKDKMKSLKKDKIS